MDDFEQRNKKFIKAMSEDKQFLDLSNQWYLAADKFEYTYHFTWMGLPIIQYPQDIIATQEIVYKLKPDLIIETGIARGGSILFYASLLQLLNNNGKVIGIDIDIREKNRKAIESHFLSENITLVEGSSTDQKIIQQVENLAEPFSTVLLALDSNHTTEHVLAELRAYEKLIKKNSYIIVFDTMVEFTPKNHFPNRPWGPGNSPMTAVDIFLRENNRFTIDREISNKLQISECPNGYLKCLKD